MALDIQTDRQQAHALLDLLPPSKLGAVCTLLEVMIDVVDEDELTEDDRHAVAASREYFRQGGEGLTFEQVVAECGFTMDQVSASKND